MNNLISVQEIVQQLNIIDDTLFQKMAEDIGFCEEMISTILGKPITVKEVTPQNSVKNLQGRSVVLDALCVSEDDRQYNVEVQKANDADHQKRVRYNTSCITTNITEPGAKFKNVPHVCSIYISKFDMFQGGKTVYHIDRVVRETGMAVDNGMQEIYVNTKIDDGTEVAELMHIFTVQDAYDFEKFPKTSARKKQFKDHEGGEEEVCELVEQYAQQVAKKEVTEQAKKDAQRFFENGVGYDMVRKSILSINDAELQRIFAESQKSRN